MKLISLKKIPKFLILILIIINLSTTSCSLLSLSSKNKSSRNSLQALKNFFSLGSRSNAAPNLKDHINKSIDAFLADLKNKKGKGKNSKSGGGGPGSPLKFQIVEKSSKKCLDFYNKKVKHGEQMVINTCDLKQKRQFWYLSKVSGSTYHIFNDNKSIYLYVEGGFGIFSHTLLAWKKDGKKNQIFKLLNRDKDGFFMIASDLTGKCIETNRKKNKDNTPVFNKKCDKKNPSQFWRFNLID